MKSNLLLSGLLSLSLIVSAQTVVHAHAGHGDEFQATGGVNRVEVKVETDSLLGIQVNPIEIAEDGSSAVLIPATALVDDGDRQLVFVQYENFYEPVEVTTGETQGELIEVTDGLSIGEQLVTGGSLSLYAESRKTQTVEAETTEAEPAAVATAPAESAEGSESPVISELDEAHAQAHAEGTPHSHDSGSESLKTLLGAGVGVALVGSILAFFFGKRGGKGEAL